MRSDIIPSRSPDLPFVGSERWKMDGRRIAFSEVSAVRPCEMSDRRSEGTGFLFWAMSRLDKRGHPPTPSLPRLHASLSRVDRPARAVFVISSRGIGRGNGSWRKGRGSSCGALITFGLLSDLRIKLLSGHRGSSVESSA